MEIFGYEITKRTKQPDVDENPKLQTFTPKQDDDGSLTVVSGSMFGQIVDIDGMIKNDGELITKYRTMSDHPAMNMAITAIVNESIINEPEEPTVKIDMSETKFPVSVKKTIEQEFQNILNLLNFEQNGYEIFRRWYIDGRIYYHAMVDFNNTAKGIQELRYIDPRKIRRVKEVDMKPKTGAGQATLVKPTRDYYLFNENGFGRDNVSPLVGSVAAYNSQTFKISKDAIIHVTSGLMEETGRSVVSYLHKSIVPLNQLNMMEQAMIIYRLARAPERRVFTVDVSGMQPQKAEQYLSSLITNAKNKVAYDPTTGQLNDQRKFQTMLEDFWLPTRDGKGTKIDVLPSAANLDQISDTTYFQQKLYQTLEIPISRLDPTDTFTLGRATEISREEVAFEKFITRLRSRFSLVLLKALRLQLLLKNIISLEDWDANKNLIATQYTKDNMFAELKENEILMGRLNLMQMIQPYVGRYYSDTWVRRKIARQTDQDIKEMDEEIVKDKNNPNYIDPLEGMEDPGGMPQGSPYDK